MTTTYTHFSDLAKEVQAPDKGILSRTLFSDDRLKVVLFGFAQGEELSEHTASMPAVLHFLQGEAKLMLGDNTVKAKPGTKRRGVRVQSSAVLCRHPADAGARAGILPASLKSSQQHTLW